MQRQSFRQGDVLLVPVNTLPDEIVRLEREEDRVVLATGEATGHVHAIVDSGAELYEMISDDDVEEMRRRFLHVVREVALVHEEHATLSLPPGEYEVIRQSEHLGLRDSRHVID